MKILVTHSVGVAITLSALCSFAAGPGGMPPAMPQQSLSIQRNHNSQEAGGLGELQRKRLRERALKEHGIEKNTLKKQHSEPGDEPDQTEKKSQ